TDAMVDHVTIIGSAGECRDRLKELEHLDFSEVALQLTVPGGAPDGMLAALRDMAPRSPPDRGRAFSGPRAASPGWHTSSNPVGMTSFASSQVRSVTPLPAD